MSINLSKGAALAVLFVCALHGAHAGPRQTDRSKQKAAAEANRAAVEQKLSVLKRDISRTASEKDDAADTLAESDVAISNANRSLRELAAEQVATNAKLSELGAAHNKLVATIDAQKKQLSTLLREQYVAGNEDRIKLLLSGDNPNRINRDLQLMAYLSQAQARLLGSLRNNLAAVETNQAATQNARDELDEIAQDEREQQALLVKEKARRAALLGTLAQRLAAQRKEAGKLERDQQRLDSLVDQLAKQIKEEEAAAAAAAAEKRRQEALAAAKAKADAQAREIARAKALAEREKAAKLAAKAGTKAPPPVKPEAIEPVEPAPAPVVASKPAAEPAAPDLATPLPSGAFAALRGKMRAPVPGKVSIKYGTMFGGTHWNGVFIKAAEGTDVKAVAGGRVIFSDWSRFHGNLIIVDHGDGYWSVYAYNETLLKTKGAIVKAGEPIATAGKSGAQEESGLYFELRRNTKPFDPNGWVNF